MDNDKTRRSHLCHPVTSKIISSNLLKYLNWARHVFPWDLNSNVAIICTIMLERWHHLY